MTLTPDTTYRAPSGRERVEMRMHARSVGATLLVSTNAAVMVVQASYEPGPSGLSVRDRFLCYLPDLFGDHNANITATGDRINIRMYDHSQELSERVDVHVDANDDGS
jgi:hypothetical protein